MIAERRAAIAGLAIGSLLGLVLGIRVVLITLAWRQVQRQLNRWRRELYRRPLTPERAEILDAWRRGTFLGRDTSRRRHA